MDYSCKYNKNMKKLILSLFAALLFLSGCKTKEVIKYVNTESVRDSIVTVTVRDTMLKYLPQENAVFGVKKSYLKTDLAWSVATLDSCGLLNHSIQNFGSIPAKVIEKIKRVNSRQTLKITETITITKTVYKKGFFYYLYKYTTYTFLILLLIVFGFLFIKKRFTVK